MAIGFLPLPLATPPAVVAFLPDTPFNQPAPKPTPPPGFGFDPATLSTVLPVPYKPVALFDLPPRQSPVLVEWPLPPPTFPRAPVTFVPFDQPTPKRAPPPEWSLPPPRFPTPVVVYPQFDQIKLKPSPPGLEFTPVAPPTVQVTFTFAPFPQFDAPTLRQPGQGLEYAPAILSTVLPVPYRPTALFDSPPRKSPVLIEWPLPPPRFLSPIFVGPAFDQPLPKRISGPGFEFRPPAFTRVVVTLAPFDQPSRPSRLDNWITTLPALTVSPPPPPVAGLTFSAFDAPQRLKIPGAFWPFILTVSVSIQPVPPPYTGPRKPLFTGSGPFSPNYWPGKS